MKDNPIYEFRKKIVSGLAEFKEEKPLEKYINLIEMIILYDDIEKKPYLNTTQNHQYIRDFVKSDMENVHTILGAGDTVFQLLFNDIKNITATDITELQVLVFKLKCAAFRTLKASEYEDFLLCMDGVRFLSKDVFSYVCDGFLADEEIYIRLWEIILNYIPKDELRIDFFKGGVETRPIDVARNSLEFIKNDSSFYKVRDNLDKAKINVKIGDAIENIIDSNEKYNLIDITNILLFEYQKCSKEEWQRCLDNLIKIYNNNLADSGIMILDYMFGVDSRKMTGEDSQNNGIEEKYYDIKKSLDSSFNIEFDYVRAIPDVFSTDGKNDTVVYVKK